uniref:Uncharacterized protein n=1 Tax=Micrurus lemniscatus lemniscatus TaxID=129467 RepID=A0A2D4HNS8_MICLE
MRGLQSLNAEMKFIKFPWHFFLNNEKQTSITKYSPRLSHPISPLPESLLLEVLRTFFPWGRARKGLCAPSELSLRHRKGSLSQGLLSGRKNQQGPVCLQRKPVHQTGSLVQQAKRREAKRIVAVVNSV